MRSLTSRPWLLVHLAHLGLALCLFGDLLAGRTAYLRDLSAYYFPNYVFLAESLRGGVWPLWNPTSDGGAPFLAAYPVDLVLAGLGGAKVAMNLGIFLHAWLALSGMSVLSRRMGMGPLPAWAAGAAYGLSGALLSLVNLLPLFQAAAWAPWILAAAVALAESPCGAAVVRLALLAALQLSTLGAEVVLQTAVLALFVVPLRRFRHKAPLRALALACALALAVALPALMGALALVEGTARSAGFRAAEGMGFSLHPGMLIEAWWPRFFGDVHSSTDAGFWGQPFFPEGYPYLMSLYVGPLTLMLAALAGRRRLLWPVAVGVLVALGSYGPLAPLLAHVRLPLRAPVKFVFMPTICLALLAGLGLERWRGRPRFRATFLLAVPGLLILALAAAARWAPAKLVGVLSLWLPPASSPLALDVAGTQWPWVLGATGLVVLAGGLALLAGGRLAAAAAPLLALDLLAVNGPLNPSADAAFYHLRPEVRELIRAAGPEPHARWFSYGLANSPAPLLRSRLPSDAWLYYLDRQSLLPRAPVLDGLDSAFDVDRTGWSPAGATLTVQERVPALYRACHERLRGAAVRYVLSFLPLPEDLVSEVGRAPLPGLVAPLRLYELRDPLPRAFVLQGSLRDGEGGWHPDPSTPPVGYARLDAHRVLVRTDGPPGSVVVLDGYHPAWRATEGGVPVPLQRAGVRALVLVTPGGRHEYLLEFLPRWRRWSLASCALGLLACGILLGRFKLDSPTVAR